MIEIFLYSVIYSFCAFMPILILYAVYMILTDRWKIQTLETDEEIDEFMESSFFFNKQAD